MGYDEKPRLPSRLTNPFRRTHESHQDSDSTKQSFPNEKEDFKPPPGPPPGYTQASTSTSASSDVFQPPPGPPPSVKQYAGDFQPPSGSPPSARQYTKDFQPPPGPPPPSARQYAGDFQPPPGPPPSVSNQGAGTQPPEYAPWMTVPDTSQLPPPPAMVYEESPTANATGLSADEATAWCHAHPIGLPQHLLPHDAGRVAQYDINLTRPPPGFAGRMSRSSLGTWLVSTRPVCNDTILTADLPVFSALESNPAMTGRPKTIYFEIKIVRMGGGGSFYAEADAGIAIGFVAKPYPHWRLPGWERASLGVHGDDGRKYVHNNMGGQDFTTAFRDGEVVGIGMTFIQPRSPGAKAGVEVFFTREGEKVGGWDLHEERDRDIEGSVAGLEGDRDLFAAVGMFGGVEFETRFRRDQWLYRPRA